MDSESDVDIEPVVPMHVRHGPSRYDLGHEVVWRVGCSCGWGMELSDPPNTKEEAEKDLRYHLAEVVPPRAGEEFYAATRPGFELISGVETESWYKAAIRSRAKWRRDFPKWLCDHKHESDADALACAEKELPLWLKDVGEYKPKPGEEFYASSNSYSTPLRRDEQEGFYGVIVSRSKSPDEYNIVRWRCGHRHKFREDAVTCAEEQLKDERWHPKD